MSSADFWVLNSDFEPLSLAHMGVRKDIYQVAELEGSQHQEF
jgi:hypothetical protein